MLKIVAVLINENNSTTNLHFLLRFDVRDTPLESNKVIIFDFTYAAVPSVLRRFSSSAANLAASPVSGGLHKVETSKFVRT